MALEHIGPELFALASVGTAESNASAEPAHGYWRRVGLQLRANRQAFAALIIIIALLLFALLGPLLWRLDPAEQNIGLISQGPLWQRSGAVITGRKEWRPVSASVPDDRFELHIRSATTLAVRLQWPAISAASKYQIYRHRRQPQNMHDLGLPVGETTALQTHFEDRLQLKTQPYFYTVVAVAANQSRIAAAQNSATPHLAISFFEAQLRGFVPLSAAPERWLGQQISLPAHPLGTDYLGRDMLARLMHGARTSLFIGVCAPLVFVLFGALYGAAAGYSGGRTDNVMMRATDLVIALPFLLFMILLKVAFGLGPGDSGVPAMLIALILLSWPSSARLVRAEVLQLRTLPYISAARLMGASTPYLMLRHFAPGALPVMLVAFTFAVPSAIFTEAFLSFIGIGVVPPTPSWGTMSFDGIKSLLSHPHELLFPAVFISVTVLAFNLFGDGLRDAMDVKTSEQ